MRQERAFRTILSTALIAVAAAWATGASSPTDDHKACEDWFDIRSENNENRGTLNIYNEAESLIHSDIVVKGDLLDIRVDDTVAHLDPDHLNSSVTLDYRINQAVLPTGPVYLSPCWNCWSIIKLPVRIGRLRTEMNLKRSRRLCDALIGGSGKIWFKGEGEFSATIDMTKLSHQKESPLPSGVYAINRLNFGGYLRDPDLPSVKDVWNGRRYWLNSKRMCERTTFLLADLTTFEFHLDVDSNWKKGSPVTADLSLIDADGRSFSVPGAEIECVLHNAEGERCSRRLQGEWREDPATMSLMIPTGTYSTPCPFDVVKATVQATVGVCLPGGKKTRATVSKQYRTSNQNTNVEP